MSVPGCIMCCSKPPKRMASVTFQVAMPVPRRRPCLACPMFYLVCALCVCCVCSVLGTPTESSWPNVTDLDDWNVGFPKWPRIGLTKEYADLGEIGINMLEVGWLCSTVLGRAFFFASLQTGGP